MPWRSSNAKQRAARVCSPFAYFDRSSFEFKLRSLWPARRWGEFLLAVWNPDVLHLHGVIEEPPAFALFQVEPVDGAALVGEHLLQIANRESFHRSGADFIRKTPDSVDVVVFGECLHQFRVAAGDHVYDAIRQIASFENLIQIAGNQRIFFRRK